MTHFYFQCWFIVERAQTREGQREGDRGSEVSSAPTATSPVWGLNSRTTRPWPEPKVDAYRLSGPGAPLMTHFQRTEFNKKDGMSLLRLAHEWSVASLLALPDLSLANPDGSCLPCFELPMERLMWQGLGESFWPWVKKGLRVLLKLNKKPNHSTRNEILGAPGWLSRLSVWLQPRLWSHASWVRAPHRALCWQA